MRAVLFCLAVIAQLMLPAVQARAFGIGNDLCTIDDGGEDGGSSKFQDHGKQCAHCRIQHCSPFAPPAAASILIEPVELGASLPDEALLPLLDPLRAQPPPTGPPPG